MKLTHIIHEVFEKPWCITPHMHRTIQAIVTDHVTGAAHATGGRAELFSGMEDEEDTIHEIQDGVMTINVNGVIARGIGQLSKMSGMCDCNDILYALDRAGLDDVTGVFININSPGGGVNGLDEISSKILELKTKKPVVCFVESLCASAAYWVASGASEIVATRTAHVGSIGVYMYLLDTSIAHAGAGVKPIAITTGKYKGLGLPGVPISDEQIELLRDEVAVVFGWFKSAVLAGRGTVEDDYMQGQTLMGDAALPANLIDAVGDRKYAMAELENLMKGKAK